MPLVVTGISQNADISATEKALQNAGLSLEPLEIYVSGDAEEEHPEASRGFIYTGTDSIRDMLGRGSSGIYSSGGGSLPDIEPNPASTYFPETTIASELGELDIPDSELENYEEAIDSGHGVVAYFARPETLSAVEDCFRAAGLANVRTF